MATDYKKKIIFDKEGEHFYETGIRKVVLYQKVSGAFTNGVAWNGVTAITESPSGAEPTPLYADDIKYLNLLSNEEFAATIEAYTYPDEFAECDGSKSLLDGVTVGQQSRKTFGLCYRTVSGNDTDHNEHGYKLHIIYNCLAAPTDRAYATINDSPEAITFSWELSTTPVEFEIEDVTGIKPTATLVIDSNKVDEDKLEALEEILYGKDPTTGTVPAEGVAARLPLPDEIYSLLS